MRTTSGTGSLPARSSRLSSASPSSNSIARKGTPRSSPTSKMVTTWGCFSAAAVRASRKKRSRAEGLLASAGSITFSATAS
jgi:hypothetical protein